MWAGVKIPWIAICGVPLLAKCARNGSPHRAGGAYFRSRFLTGLGARFGMTGIWDWVGLVYIVCSLGAEARFIFWGALRHD